MANRPIAPIPQDKIGESFVWRDWFQKLSDKVYGSMSEQNSNAINVSGGTANNVNFSNVTIVKSKLDSTPIGQYYPSTGYFTSVKIDKPLAVIYGGTGTSTPSLIAGTNITITGAWPNQTINSSGGGGGSGTAPVTYTVNFTVAATDIWIINNKPSTSCVATLPTPSANTGRILRFQNYQSQTLVSASSNVVPLVGGGASTAILAAVAGDTCTLVSNGTSWIMTQYVPNNVLLLE